MNIHEIAGRLLEDKTTLTEQCGQLLGVLHGVCVGTIDPCRVEVNLEAGTCTVLPAGAVPQTRQVDLTERKGDVPAPVRERLNGQLPHGG